MFSCIVFFVFGCILLSCQVHQCDGKKVHFVNFRGQYDGRAQDLFYSMMEGRWNLSCDAPLQPMVLNVGANVGQNFEYYWDQFGKTCSRTSIHLFEPNPKMFVKLRKNALASAWNSRYKVHELGMSDVSSRLVFAVPKNATKDLTGFLITDENAQDIIYETKKKFDTFYDKYVVNVSTLDSMFPDSSNMKIPLLKIDAEGFDGRVIKGGLNLLKNAVEVVIFECSELYRRGRVPLKEIVNLLGERGFSTFKLGYPSSIRLDPPYWNHVYEPRFWADCIGIKKTSPVLEMLPLLC